MSSKVLLLIKESIENSKDELEIKLQFILENCAKITENITKNEGNFSYAWKIYNLFAEYHK